MDIITKEKIKYTYLKKDLDTNIVTYYEQKSGKFYSLETKKMDANWGFGAMFLAPLTLFLRNNLVTSTWGAYLLACFVGIICGCICSYLLHRTYSSSQLNEIDLSSNEIKACIDNLKKVKQSKIALIFVWIFFFLLMSIMFFDEKSYSSLAGLSIVCCFLIPLGENLNFYKDYKIKNKIAKKIN